MAFTAAVQGLLTSIRQAFRVARIRAVHDDDLPSLLNSLGIADDLAAGKLKCASCGVTLVLENIWAFKKEGGQITVFCLSPACISAPDALQ